MEQRQPFVFPLALIFLAAVVANEDGFAETPDTGLTLQFIARGAKLIPKVDLPPKESQSPPEFSLAGHIFIIVGVKTQSGIKEEYFGFYPKGNAITAQIKGPGMLKAEYRCSSKSDCNPEKELRLLRRFSEAEASVTIPITEAQRSKAYKIIIDWNEKQYSLTDQNCETFVGEVAASLGYPVPPPGFLQTPVSYLENVLRPIVEQENKRRQAVSAADAAEKRMRTAEQEAEKATQAAEQRRQEAEKAAQTAEQRQQQAEKAAKTAENRAKALEEKRRLEEERAKNFIPSGWVKCNCPFVHASIGKLVNGERWHDPSISCPP